MTGSNAKWDASQMQALDGKLVVVTGANSGIGFVAALELARHGADVVLACRSDERGQAAEHAIHKELARVEGAGRVKCMQLDVSSLASVKKFVEEFKKTHESLDVLINNAGIMAVPHALTVDGYESQFATNHLGHFALTAQLFDLLKRSKEARIVNLASVMHWFARMKLDRIVTPPGNYRAIQVYSNTKLYNVLFMKELDRRIRAAGIDNVKAVGCHPGYTNTNLVTAPSTKSNWFMRFWWGIFIRLPLGQRVEMGALPTLFAATCDTVQSGEYYGPDGFLALRGHPRLERTRNQSDSPEAATSLWAESERLAGLTFKL